MKILPIEELEKIDDITEPVFITKNGILHLVVISHEEYNEREKELETIKADLDRIKKRAAHF